jgi:hypothetical protein
MLGVPMTDLAVHVLRQMDVADAIDLEELTRRLSGLEPTRGAAILRGPERATGAGIVLRNEPIDLRMGQRTVGSFEASVRLRAFDFGVIALRFTFTIAADTADDMIDLARRVAAESAAFDHEARALWKELSAKVEEAIAPWKQPPADPLIEDYTVFTLPKLLAAPDPDDLLAHVLLAEPVSRRLASSLVKEIARRAIRYYEDDLVLLDYDTAVVVDETGGADLVDLFEIASAQLLELRYYDAVLARALGNLYSDVKRAKTAWWLVRSPFRGLARQAAALALEVSEMSDRLERAITLVGETYFVQVYREAALRFRLPEAGTAVRDKINMVTRVSEVAQNEVQSRRGMAVELLVVLLIALEIVIAIRWPGH